jgi:lysophospholipid hydrolase
MYRTRKRSANAIAIRKSEVARIQLQSYKILFIIAPSVAFSLSKIVASNAASTGNGTSEVVRSNYTSNPRTIAILPLSAEVPIEQFVKGLTDAIINLGIKKPGNLAILDSNTILRSLGGNVFDKIGNLRLENYITHLEDNLEVIICMGDTSAHSTWTRMCISHVSQCLILPNTRH